MSDKSSFSDCCQACCFPCYHCLCPEQHNGNKYPGIQYRTPEKANVSVRKLTIYYKNTKLLLLCAVSDSIRR